MKKILFKYIPLLAFTLLCFACKRQNVPMPLRLQNPAVGTPEYYENLRAYKLSNHELAFGWFGGSGNTSANPDMENSWQALPDSMDLISCWGGPPQVGSAQYAAMKLAQQQRGIKVLYCTFDNDPFFTSFGGANFITKYVTGDTTLLNQGFAIIAKSLADTVAKYSLDGVDFDHEPNVCGCSNWNVAKNTNYYSRFLKAVSKYFGPLSGTDKIVDVDGEVNDVFASNYGSLTYLIQQAYGQSQGSVPGGFPPGKYILTENFESYWSTGGTLLQQAAWEPSNGKKGGSGAYHMEYDYQNNPDYKYMRRAIQIMNPAVH